MSINFLYKSLFFRIIKYAHINKISSLLKLFYPSLKFKVINFPNYYFTNISFFSKKLILTQLNDRNKRSANHKERKLKNIYYYKKLNKLKNNKIKIIKMTDFNYQNFLDFPLLVKNKIIFTKVQEK